MSSSKLGLLALLPALLLRLALGGLRILLALDVLLLLGLALKLEEALALEFLALSSDLLRRLLDW